MGKLKEKIRRAYVPGWVRISVSGPILL